MKGSRGPTVLFHSRADEIYPIKCVALTKLLCERNRRRGWAINQTRAQLQEISLWNPERCGAILPGETPGKNSRAKYSSRQLLRACPLGISSGHVLRAGPSGPIPGNRGVGRLDHKPFLASDACQCVRLSAKLRATPVFTFGKQVQ